MDRTVELRVPKVPHSADWPNRAISEWQSQSVESEMKSLDNGSTDNSNGCSSRAQVH